MSILGCRIYTKINRPSPELVMRFSNFASADIADCMNRLASMDSGIKPFNNVRLFGTAVTVNMPNATNLLFHQALDMVQEGDVVLVNAGRDTTRAVCGENMVEIAKERGGRGFVVDGALRDSACLRNQKDFAVFARTSAANAAYKFNSPGEINVPIAVGGIVVYPGDIIVGDQDGVVAIRPKYAVHIADEVENLMKKQAKNLELIKKGHSDRSWVAKYLMESGCTFIDKTWYEDN